MGEQEYRIERDSMGEMRVPAWALWGASTQRAVENFPVSGRPMPVEIIHAFGHLKKACAIVNRDLGKLPADKAQAIADVCDEIIGGELDRHFPVDVYQTGSGTSTNMNVNEVIANRAAMRSGVKLHPNDDVNMGQSSNDTFPTAMHVAAVLAFENRLDPAIDRVGASLDARASEWDHIIKCGRTHLMDATPIRVGQMFAGYLSQIVNSHGELVSSFLQLRRLAIGGTAVGTGVNTHPQFGRRVCEQLERMTGIPFEEVDNHVAAQAAKDDLVSTHGQLKTLAVSLSKIASDIRLLGSGPRAGLFELILPPTQPGSSIMPGKVNPVICESVIQVCCRVIANDAAVTLGGLGGVGSILELNVAMPLIADAVLESIRLLTGACNVFYEKLLVGLRVNEERCRELLDRSLMMVTALAPEIGYDAAAKLAKEAFERGLTIRQVVLEHGLIPADKLDRLLDPRRMTEPGG